MLGFINSFINSFPAGRPYLRGRVAGVSQRDARQMIVTGSVTRKSLCGSGLWISDASDAKNDQSDLPFANLPPGT